MSAELASTQELAARVCSTLADLLDATIAEMIALNPDGAAKSASLTQPASHDETLGMLTLMVQGIGVSLRSMNILLASNPMAVRDCFGIARSICEGAVNVGFMALDGSAADQAKLHAAARLYREGARQGTVAGLTFAVRRKPEIALEDFPGLEAALARFTRPSGSERTSWTERSIDDRINEIEQACADAGKSLAAARFLIYRQSSEVIHGSFYGVFFFWGLERLGANISSGARSSLGSHIMTCAATALFSVDGMLRALDKRYGLPRPKAFVLQLMKQMEAVIGANFTATATADPPS